MRIFITAALLASALAGCGAENPFGGDPGHQWEGGTAPPVVTGTWTMSSGGGSSLINDIDPLQDGIQDALVIQFDKPMAPSGFTVASLALETTWPSTGAVQIDEVIYEEETARAKIWATFTTETAFMLTIQAGALSDLSGDILDANHNGVFDGAPWDDHRSTFHTGSAPEADLRSPVLDAHNPAGGGLGNPLPDISVNFGFGPMDTATLTADNFTLVRTSDSSEVSVQLIAATPDQIVIRPRSDLAWGERYTVRLSASVADESGNLLDVNGDGFVWPDEADYLWDFQLADDASSHGTPPTVAGVLLGPDREWILVEFYQSLTHIPVVMDAGSYTAATIVLHDNQGLVPLTFQPQPSGRQVICFPQRYPGEGITLAVTSGVRDEWGNGLDGNEDGMGGTPGDDWVLSF